MFDVQYTGLTQLKVRLGAVGGRVTAALEEETRRQMGLMADAVRSNIVASFRNPERMRSAVGSRTQRAGDVITGEVDASGELTGTVLPFMSIQESGGTTQPHVIEARAASVLAFFWESAGVQFFGKRVNHPGSKIEGRHFVQNAFDARREATIAAFREVLGVTVQETVEA
jgi:hypothetical protein